MSRLDEWCNNLFRIFAPHHGPNGAPARFDKKESEEEKTGGGGSGGSSGSGGYKVQPNSAPSPFNTSGGGFS
jgi:hypothetical protein